MKGYSRHQVTAAVTEQYKSCLKLTAIKQACLLQTWQPSFRAVIRAKRLKKLPKMYNKSFLITQPCSERFERKKVMICYVKRPCLSLNAFFPTTSTNPEIESKEPSQNLNSDILGEFWPSSSLLSPLAAASSVSDINRVEPLHNSQRQRKVAIITRYGSHVICHLYLFAIAIILSLKILIVAC